MTQSRPERGRLTILATKSGIVGEKREIVAPALALAALAAEAMPPDVKALQLTPSVRAFETIRGEYDTKRTDPQFHALPRRAARE